MKRRRYQTAEEFEAWALLWRQIDKFVRVCGGQPTVEASTTPKASAIANRIELAVEAIGAAIVVQDRKQREPVSTARKRSRATSR